MSSTLYMEQDMSFEEKGTNAAALADIDRPVVGDDDALLHAPERTPRLPPRWFIRSFWVVHRALYSVTGGRLGLRPAKVGKWGMLRIRTVGRRTGAERSAILGYLEDGPNLITLAMNGWADPEPAWWLNLQANPHARIDLASGSCSVSARAAVGEERARLWAMWGEETDAYAARRSRDTAVVILEPQPDA
jgi:deazaflavin-dependent oxidoreductase (nitroreductase family)